MKYNINYLYFAKCRHCIMDIIMNYKEDEREIKPRPDYVDYYTILLYKSGKYINVFDKYRIYINKYLILNDKEYYKGDLILEVNPISNYIGRSIDKLSFKECQLIENTIVKTKSLKHEYGYKR